ncbi:multifunctional 2',3'-cyclic-nucleotide 2'-phosphodiesterase/5'-nucleotidase/3'-nucleotidase [Paenibacillus yonginensis]|uniref:Multifunctional 2',3'-cyclic-nucleotide 2'-phosphodiesterase/5'-nucleotidase/3'-nucleotidase n=1 Tax=Paenibacillus yonginensis TaxID=1462996 RepID=A0A1B1MX38_9BACL|nr:bifunctional UDP-sugar hydrolase/5'-nucleotidase [Paenibacillus yonginensis]ANS73719.1 multifunctional 2',3'-cyclic-nucleotide 2'-phosphodiesterase/5'-nucleotidase/3'-nucleotidase [Paenibacillus yonginensis]
MQQHTESEQLMILHTNDIHSHFGAMVQLSEMIEAERQIWRDDLLLLDIGDHMDRAAVETEGTLGQANVDVLNLTGYDAVTIGNNEGLTFTPELLEQAYAGLQCPVVCCNIKETSTGAAPGWMKEHHIVVKAGFTIGLIGATAAFSEFYRILGWEALDPIESIRSQVEQIRGQVDFVILMSHLGLRMDEQLAEEVRGIDLILGGHSHHLLEEPLYIKETCLAAAEKYGHYLGRILIGRNPAGQTSVQEGGVLKVDPPAVGREGEREPLNKVGEAIAIHARHAAEQLKRTVAITQQVLPVQYDGESPFANLLAQSVRRFTGSQIAIVNSGQLLGELPDGEISEGVLHALCPSPINPCRMKLKGAYILQSLEESLIPETTARPIYGFGFRGKVLGSLCVDGMEIEYDPSRAPFSRISKATIEGVPIVPEIEYDVGTLDMFTFGIGYKSLSFGTEKVFILPEFLRDLLRLELQTPGAVEQSLSSRWHKQPEH